MAALFVALFLCSQFLAAAHSAAYADVEHVHDGVPCIIAAASKQGDDLGTPPDALILAGPNPGHEYAIFSTSYEDFEARLNGLIRGPPRLV